MYDLFKASKPFMEVMSAEFEMTPQQVYALRQLSEGRPLAMSELATLLGCDASNVTSIVDKLESRGLVARRSADHDRRVKSLCLTESGIALRARVMDRMQQPPPAVDNLSTEDQAALCVLLQRALDSL
jgi:DNA-binding MarR family transcriptional regulator